MEFEVIGDTAGASPVLQEHLRNVKCSGFIKDLTTVLRPFDLHVIPWEYSTGQRTRLPVAFNHAQVVVATRAAVACYPEARDRENCRLVDRLEDMVPVITELLAAPGERSRLGRAARATFEKQFTRTSILPKYVEVLNAINSQ
jgi:glycosyltransferase involved in cell wall biosynthesis